MKKVFLAIVIFLLAVSVSGFAGATAASPFSDVPDGFWAYDAVSQLAQAGIVDGYGDGTFRGGQHMTRFEMAKIVARAMARADKADDGQKAIIDKLAVEFAAELKILGVRVDKLEAKTAIALNYESRLRYIDDAYNFPGGSTLHSKSDSDKFTWRQRVYFSGAVNDKVSFGARLSSGQANCGCDETDNDGVANFGFDQMYFVVNDFLGDKLTVGRLSTLGVTNGLLNGKDNNNDGLKLTKQWGNLLFSGLWTVQATDSEVGLYNLDFFANDNLKFNVGYQVGNWTDSPWYLGETNLDEVTKSADFGTQVKLGGLFVTGEWVDTKHSGIKDTAFAYQITNGTTGFLYPTYNLVDASRAHSDAFAVSYRKINGYATPGGLSSFNPTPAGNWGVDWDTQGYFFTYQNVLSKSIVWTAEYQTLKDVSDGMPYKTWNTSLQFFF